MKFWTGLLNICARLCTSPTYCGKEGDASNHGVKSQIIGVVDDGPLEDL